MGHIHQGLPIKTPSNTWQKGRTKFVLAALKFWNPEKDSYYLIYVKRKGKQYGTLFYQTSTTFSIGRIPTTTLSMLDTAHRFLRG